MKKTLSLISKIQEKGNRFIVDRLRENGIEGLVPSHGDILAVLYYCGTSTMKNIADRIHRTKPTVTILVDKLERQGFVRREKSPEDSRITYILLTSKGEEFRPVFEKISKDLNELLYKNLSDSEAEILDKILEKMV